MFRELPINCGFHGALSLEPHRTVAGGRSRRLLRRTTRSVSLTEAGERLLGRLDSLLSGLDQALGRALEGSLGTLRINGSEAAIRQLLQAVVPALLARHPGVELELVAEGRLVDEGRLRTVLEDWCPRIPGLFLYFPRNRHVSASLRALHGPGGREETVSAARKHVQR